MSEGVEHMKREVTQYEKVFSPRGVVVGVLC
jgi:hypothetical protein